MQESAKSGTARKLSDISNTEIASKTGTAGRKAGNGGIIYDGNDEVRDPVTGEPLIPPSSCHDFIRKDICAKCGMETAPYYSNDYIKKGKSWIVQKDNWGKSWMATYYE